MKLTIFLFLLTSALASRNLDWKIFEKYMIKVGIIDENVVNDIVSNHYNPEHLKAQRKRKGPFLSMFPEPLTHPNLTEEQVGQPLILTPYLEVVMCRA